MKKICVFTGGRAEYGLLRPLLYKLMKSKKIDLQLLVSGMHMCPEFGLTYKVIEEDGFKIDEKVEMILSSDTPTSIAKSIGLGTISYSDALERLKPDMLLTLGDRFENFSICSAAWCMRIPIAHIQGGELTKGAIDDQFRHCITKLSSLHFTATEEYRKRVIQLGENPSTVFNVGAINVESLMKVKAISKRKLEKMLDHELNDQTCLVTYHPTTLDKESSEKSFSRLLNALSSLKYINIIFTKTLADTDGRIINKMIDDYVDKNDNASAFTSLGQEKYISALKYIGAVIGNSSSGIIETASIPVATVDIGERESGRIKPKNVIWTKSDTNSIKKSIEEALSRDFQRSLKKVVNPYFKENTTDSIRKILETAKIKGNPMKDFYDLDSRL